MGCCWLTKRKISAKAPLTKKTLTVCYCIRCCIKERYFSISETIMHGSLFPCIRACSPFSLVRYHKPRRFVRSDQSRSIFILCSGENRKRKDFFMQKNSSKKHSPTTVIVCISLLVALNVILTRFLSINTTFLRIGFGFLPVAIAGAAFGPFWAAVCGAVGDVLGMMIFPSGEYFPGFTLTAILTGITFGIFLHRRYSLLKNVLACCFVCLVLNLCLDTLWLSIMYGEGYLVLLPARLIKSAINIPVYAALVHIVWSKALAKLDMFK